MKRRADSTLMAILVISLSSSGLIAADHWPSGTVLKYTYFSSGEPSGAGSAFRDAVDWWDDAATCYSFSEETGQGVVMWITDKDFWDALREDEPQMALAFGGADFSSHFCIYFNVAYRPTSDWSTSCAAGKADVKSIALHELGHVLGLDDCSSCAGTVMKKPYDMSTPDCWSGPFASDTLTVNSFCGAPPAASVEAFTPILAAGGIELRADFGQMRGSKAFWVNRQDGSLVADTLRMEDINGHSFELFDPLGTETSRYYLYERDHRGVFLRAREGVYPVEPTIVKSQPHDDIAALKQELQSRFTPSPHSLESPSGVIICPDSFVSSAEILTNFWSTHGRHVVIAPLSQTGHSREEIKTYLADAYADGVRYALLAGCASDHEWFDDPAKWPDHPGDYDWYYWYEDYHTPGGAFYWVSHPERDLIPTWYFPDTLYDNMSYWTPYYSGDWYYADGLPELRIGRLPAVNNAQLLLMISKDIEYILETSQLSWQNTVGIWGFCQSLDGNDGPLMKAIVEDFIEKIPSQYQIFALLDTNWTYIQREAEGLADWNAGRGIIWMQGTSSTAYKINHFFSKSGGWHIGKLQAGKLSLLIGANCGIGAYDQALNPTYGEPVVQDLLGEDADRGAWAVIAPTRGTWIEGNRRICIALNKHISIEPVQDIGTAFMLAQREVRKGIERQCAESFNLLGDPMAPLPLQSVASAEPQMPRPTMIHVYPNPFNATTTIEYSLARAGMVDLSIYDATGKWICSLVKKRKEAGTQRVVWNGKDARERPAASGVYFCRLDAGAFSQTRKIILLR